ncbi:peptidase M24, structural domain-containing protein [Lipomyces oligophaga]|uniref:peptidase M24, structural domain-containing protein n=1 Tax=Lipomyces oligophaga TaxID=45792 RepID=UPI0034CE9BFD
MTTGETITESAQAATNICSRPDCGNPASALQCPTCLKYGSNAYFCGQECFKLFWPKHKSVHKQLQASQPYNPFPTFQFTGPLRPVYPLSPKRTVPDTIMKPDYAVDGIPHSEQKLLRSTNVHINTPAEIEGLREACRRGRIVLDLAAAALKPGVTSDYIDQIVHEKTIELESYPSPLNYYQFPKSVCVSVNEIICHGIPDQRKFQDGDIVNIDVSLYYKGFHADLNETFYVGEKAFADADSIRLVETTREALDKAIAIVKPGMPFREIGNVIETFAKSNGCSTIRSYCGHGTNTMFHCPPSIPHYAKNKAPGVAKAGMTFTIEPMLALGTWKDKTWPDDWTSATVDGQRSAQFEHMLLVTDDGCEVLTARKPESPGGAVARI